MLNSILKIAQSRQYWAFFILLVFIMEAVALFYQYQLDYRPCVVCIHVRLWLIPVLIVAIIGWFNQSLKITALCHFLMMALMMVLIERAYVLLSTERGWAFGSCDFDLGLPSWFTVEEWLPSVFKVWEPCGYTPELIFGITMAEALMVMSVVLALASALFTLTLFIYRNRHTL